MFDTLTYSSVCVCVCMCLLTMFGDTAGQVIDPHLMNRLRKNLLLTILLLWVELNREPNSDQNRAFSRLNSVNLHVFSRCPQIDHNSSKFHHFSSSLNTVDDHPMKKSFFTKTIIFFSLQRGIDHRNETTTAFL